MILVFAIVFQVIITLIESAIVYWLGPNTGIHYFDVATFWNIFWLVAIANMVVGFGSQHVE